MKFKIPVKFSKYGIYEIEANSIDEAKYIAIYGQQRLPEYSSYVDGSLRIVEEDIERHNTCKRCLTERSS